jgi:hypothetical protein
MTSHVVRPTDCTVGCMHALLHMHANNSVLVAWPIGHQMSDKKEKLCPDLLVCTLMLVRVLSGSNCGLSVCTCNAAASCCKADVAPSRSSSFNRCKPE